MKSTQNNVLLSILILLVLVAIGFSGYNFFTAPKLAYVKTADLLKGFKGMNDAKSQYNQTMNGYQANLDTLKNQYYKSLQKYTSSKKKNSAAENKVLETELQMQVENIRKYQTFMEENVEAEDSKLTDRVYGQINTYVVEYGKEKGYDIIFGTNSMGSVMYGKEAKDITKEVLIGLNKKYEGGE